MQRISPKVWDKSNTTCVWHCAQWMQHLVRRGCKNLSAFGSAIFLPIGNLVAHSLGKTCFRYNTGWGDNAIFPVPVIRSNPDNSGQWMILIHSIRQGFLGLYCDAHNLILGHFRDYFIHFCQGCDDAIARWCLLIIYSWNVLCIVFLDKIRSFICHCLGFRHSAMIWVVCFTMLLSSLLNSPPWTKLPPFRSRNFQMDFREWKVLYFDYNFTEVCS